MFRIPFVLSSIQSLHGDSEDNRMSDDFSDGEVPAVDKTAQSKSKLTKVKGKDARISSFPPTSEFSVLLKRPMYCFIMCSVLLYDYKT